MIAQINFAGVPTSRVGFGCGRLNGGIHAAASSRLVEGVLKLGIRHFDVAPAYGMGLAEDVLGAALANEAVTVVTKVGIARPPHPGVKGVAQALLGPVLAHLPAVKARLVSKAVQSASRGQFGLEHVEKSFAESLRRLRRDRVDALLLHEAAPADVTAELTALLTDWQAKGRTALLGSGTGKVASGLTKFGEVAQYRWTSESLAEGVIDVVHGVLRYLPKVVEWTPEQVDDLALLGRDPADPLTHAGIAMTRVLALNPHSIVLVSSRNVNRIGALLRAIDWVLVSEPTETSCSTMQRILSNIAVS